MRYSQEALEELAGKIDLVEYIGNSVDYVKKSNDTYFAVCPFHNEKTASFAVNKTDQFFFCFGCGKTGNIYTWIQLHENLTFDKAVQKVAELTNSNINHYVESESVSFFKMLQRLLSTAENPAVINRTILDIDKDYCQRFKDEVPQEWIDEGISEDEMKKYEIRIDPQSNRIVYPVYDAEFRFIGVKGRTRFKNYKSLKIMKYMNYNKISTLNFFTGMKQAEEFIKEKSEIIIVEGLKSVMKIDSWGYHNAVSAETSVLNEHQIELLVKLQVKDVIIAFDKDVSLSKIKECTRLLKKFSNIWVIYDRWSLLKEKDSPCDQGKEVWDTLYERRERL
jgi:DNA primase